jgi:hypothetical protein
VVPSSVRLGLANLGVVQGLIALWALFAPRSFFGDFPVRRADWVDALPPFNEHLVRDYGASFLALSVFAIAAAWIGERRIVVVALVVWLVSAVPHFAFHLAHSDAPDGLSGVVSLVTLGINVAFPLVLLFLVRKEIVVR